MLVKSPGFTLVAVLTLALGVGANTALFSVVDAVLLKTLPVTQPEQLVLFEWEAGKNFRTGGMRVYFIPHPAGRTGASMFRYDIYEKLREEQSHNEQSPLSSLFAFAPLSEQTVLVNDQAENAQIQGVSGNYFAGLGVQPLLGRPITEADDNVSAPPVAVLSYAYWQERFGGGPGVVGQQLKINDLAFTIGGGSPPRFSGSFPGGRQTPLTPTPPVAPALC